MLGNDDVKKKVVGPNIDRRLPLLVVTGHSVMSAFKPMIMNFIQGSTRTERKNDARFNFIVP